MGNCTLCKDEIGMPYKCKLCGNKYCSKHRLPENHSCSNIGIYSTPEYKRAKIMKEIEIKEAKGITSITSPNYASNAQNMWSATWSTGSQMRDLGMYAFLIALVVFIKTLSFVIFVSTFVLAFIFVNIVYSVRKNYSERHGLSTRLVLSPVGIAVTFIFGILGGRWILIGWFEDDESSDKIRSEIGIVTILTMVSLTIFSDIIFYVMLPNLLNVSNQNIIQAIGFASVILGYLVLWIALISYLPIRNFDGARILRWDIQKYFIGLIFLVVLVFGYGIIRGNILGGI